MHTQAKLQQLMKEYYDFTIIGGGIVGASTAMQLKQKHPKKSILLIEKEQAPAQHQTGHNSGVIHAGVYYAPGSLKADFCRRGLKSTIEFCKENDISFNQCGKLIVATEQSELSKLEDLFQNSKENGLDVSWIEQNELSETEPNIRGIRAFLVKDSAIVDYSAITRCMLDKFVQLGGHVEFNTKITELLESEKAVTLTTSSNTNVDTGFLVACAGLQADRVAKMIGIKPNFRIVPFKGEYFKLPSSKNNIVKHLIYPVPDPGMPFLGVHLTRMIDGSVTVGPNAVLSLHREGYRKLSLNIRDLFSMLAFPGFWKVILSNFSSGISEIKNSAWKSGYLKLVQRYSPSIELNDLEPYAPGIRAQAVMRNGDLVHDFLFMNTPRSLHVCNAPSPAATSAIPIGEYICEKIDE